LKDDIHRPVMLALRMIGKIRAGDAPSTTQFNPGTTIRLATGTAAPQALPYRHGKHCSSADGTTTILREISPSENIRRHDEDVPSDGYIAQRGTMLDARHIATPAAVDHCRVAAMTPRIRGEAQDHPWDRRDCPFFGVARRLAANAGIAQMPSRA
jgi:molybdopterin biosynthesis enzyme